MAWRHPRRRQLPWLGGSFLGAWMVACGSVVYLRLLRLQVVVWAPWCHRGLLGVLAGRGGVVPGAGPGGWGLPDGAT